MPAPVTAGQPSIRALADVHARIAAAQARSPHAASHVTLVAVTKSFPVTALEWGFTAGLRTFGENRVPEAEAKLPQFAHREQSSIHLVGHLQSNKAARAVQLFNLIESVDSLALMRRIDRLAGARDGEYPIYLQVNAGHDETKFGFLPQEVMDQVAELQALSHIRIAGIMTMAPFSRDEALLRTCFATARQVRDELQTHIPSCTALSMGMTNDFELAIEEGATHIRLGRALFGERPVR